MYWQTPVAEKPTSLLRLPSAEQFGATNIKLSQKGGVAFGLELYALDDAANGNRISLDLGARVDAHFEGRDYSEMWEVFAFAGDAAAERAARPRRGSDDGRPAGPLAPRHLEHRELPRDGGPRRRSARKLGKHVRFAAMVDVIWKTDHVITFADAGVDLPTCGAPGVTGNCEDEENDLVNPGTAEVNPLHVPRDRPRRSPLSRRGQLRPRDRRPGTDPVLALTPRRWLSSVEAMRLPAAAVLGLSTVLGLSAGACRAGSRADRLAQRAAFDLGCTTGELWFQKIDDRTTKVTGCGKHGTYVESCDGLHTSKDTTCSWVLVGKLEVNRTPQPDLDPDPGDVAAPTP